MSILNSLAGMITPELLSGVAGHLGENNDGVKKAMGGIFPTLLSGFMNSKQEDHSMLSGLLNQAGGDNGNIVTSLLGALTGGNSNSGIAGIGSQLVSGLLGGKAGAAVNLISSLAGIKSGSSSSLMNIGGSLLASFLGKKMLGDKLNIGGIMSMITGQKSEIMAAAPAGLASTLGFSNMVDDAKSTINTAASTATRNVVDTTTSTGGNGGGGMKWLLPLLLLGALVAGLAYFLKGCNKTEGSAEGTEVHADATAPVDANAATTATVTTTDAPAATGAATAATTPATAGAVESIKVKLVDGTEINANKGGVEDKLVSFLSSTNAKFDPNDKAANWYDFDNLNFDLGKSTITSGSMVQIANLAAILKAYPALKIKVGGYTDKKGDDASNKKLSQSRADAVIAALKAKGANVAQLTGAEGYGEELAKVEESASDEARRADRRTAVRIMAK
jgi:outer membrane protein OmpA-like peptidoglycan-associated protein